MQSPFARLILHIKILDTVLEVVVEELLLPMVPKQIQDFLAPYALDAALLGPVRRPRLYWSSFQPQSLDLTFGWDKKSGIHRGRLLAPVESGLTALESKKRA